MIFEVLMNPIFLLIGFIVDNLPLNIASNEYDISSFFTLIGKGFVIFPADLFFMLIGNVVGWLSIQMGWSIFEWVYRKIPGVS